MRKFLMLLAAFAFVATVANAGDAPTTTDHPTSVTSANKKTEFSASKLSTVVTNDNNNSISLTFR